MSLTNHVLRALACALVLGAGSASAQGGPVDEGDAGDAPATMLELRDGSIQWGTIRAHDPDGITFARLDNGGLVRLEWSRLHPDQERELRSEFGYVDLTGDEVFIDADRIVTVDGTEFVGIIVDRTSDAILLKTSGATIPVPKNRVAGASTTVQVPALEVYTKDELYGRESAGLALGTAEGNFKLAQFCERIFDFPRAIEHYQKTAELDPKYRTEDVRLATQRATERAKLQDQLEYLAQIDVLTVRRKYDEAFALAAAFKEKYPGSALLPDAKRKQDRVVKARDRFVADRVMQMWYTQASRLATAAAMKMGLEEARAYLDDRMKDELLAKVAKEAARITKEATPDVVRQMWVKRNKSHWYRASYGYGTWLLGRDAALKGQKAEEKKPELNAKDKQRAELEEKIRRFLENQEMARKAKSTAEQSDDHEALWKELPSASRAQWILAYYAENSGDFELGPKPIFSACRECGGQGVREILLAGNNVAKQGEGGGSSGATVECPTCHGLGIIRRILYR